MCWATAIQREASTFAKSDKIICVLHNSVASHTLHAVEQSTTLQITSNILTIFARRTVSVSWHEWKARQGAPLHASSFNFPQFSKIRLYTNLYLRRVKILAGQACCHLRLRDVMKRIPRISLKADLRKYSQKLTSPRTFWNASTNTSVRPILFFSEQKCVKSR